MRFEGATCTYNIVEEVEGDNEIDYEEDGRYTDIKIGFHEHIRVAAERKHCMCNIHIMKAM